MKKHLLFLGILMMSIPSFYAQNSKKGVKKPNIIIFMADDMGY